VIESLLVDATNSSTLYVIVDGAILKSTNGGANWSKAAAGLTATDVQAVAAGANDPASIFIGAGNRILKSGDGGATWIGLSSLQYFTAPGSVAVGSFFPNNSPAFPRVLLLDITNPNVLFTGTTRGNGCYFADNLIYKSTDGGVNWSGSASPNDSGCVLDGGFGPSAGLKAMDPTDPNTLYLAEADDGDGDWALLKSQDGGASWNSLGFPAEQQAGVWAVAIDPGNPATLYAGLDDYPQYQDDGSNVPGMGGVFKSTDGGATWNSIGLSGAVNVLALDPTHPSVVYAATEGNYSAPQGFRGLFKTNDGGASWTSINNGLASLLGVGSVTSMAIDPANFNAVYIGTSGNGIFKSSDGGATWGPFNDGLANFEVHGLAIAAGAGHTVYAATSGGVFKVIDAAP
jgi:photosystem II stability/assembly factor-like uncharacterized protein